MKASRWRVFGFLALATCAVLAATASQAMGMAISDKPVSSYANSDWAVSDGNIFYAKDMGDPLQGPLGPFEIGKVNAATGIKTVLIGGVPEGVWVDLDADGDRVAYTAAGGLYLLAGSSGPVGKLPTASASVSNPAIDYPYVAYEVGEATGKAIWVMDLRTNTEKRVAFGIRPRISGSRVVYQDTRNNNTDVYWYDVAAGSEKRLTTNASSQAMPDISGTIVVWSDYRRGPGRADLYTQNLLGGTARRLTTTGNNYGPAISGSKIVYSGLRMYDLATGKDRALTRNSGASANGPQYDKGVIAYNVYYESWDPNGVFYATLPVVRLSATGPAVISYRGRAAIGGTLLTPSLTPHKGRNVALDVSTNGRTWTRQSTKKTNSSGKVSFTTPKLSSTRYYRLRYTGDKKYLGEWSDVLKVEPRVSIGVPKLSDSTPKAWQVVDVTGTLKPRHKRGAVAATIEVYQFQNGMWTLNKIVSAKASNYKTYSKYKASMSFPTAGTWRMRAHHAADSKNASAYSDYLTFIVE